jgi:glycosyltransferase involved in cell wall biosynthesis
LGSSLKILQVIPTLNPAAGGPVEGLIQQGIAMVKNGHNVQTVCLDAPGSPLDERLSSSAVYLLGPSYLGYGFAPRLEPWLREHGAKYDIIIIHGMWSYHGYCVAKVARQLGLRYVVFLHGMLDPWFARQYPRKHLKKWLYWPWAEYRTLRDAQLVLFTTAEEMVLARQSFWLYKARERLVGYGIKAPDVVPAQARTAFLEIFPELEGKRNLLYLSRIHPKKGCDLLIPAFAKAAAADPALHLIMAGPGDAAWIVELKNLARQLNVENRITFTGMLKGSVKWGAYDVADAFVLPSHQENFGIVVAEALAWGVPVLTTYQVNIWREIKEAGAGIIHPDTQVGADQLLSDWVALSPEDKNAMRVNAKACFAKNFEIETVTHNLLQALEDVLASNLKKHTFVGSFAIR